MRIQLKTKSQWRHQILEKNDGTIRILKIFKSWPIFLTMKTTFNLNKSWHEVRYYQDKFAKKIHDNTIKVNIAVTSSNLSRNDGTIRILIHFLVKNQSKLPIADKNLILSITLHLTCAFQVIELRNERVLALFHQFCYNFHISLKSGQTPQLHDLLSRAFHKYWQLLICILIDLGWVYKLTTSKRSDKQWLRFKEGVATTIPSPPPPGQIC